MKKALLMLVMVFMAGGLVFGAFPTNNNTAVLDLSNRSADWTDFLFTIRGFEDQSFSFTVSNSAGYVDLTGYYCGFKASQRVAGGTNRVAILKAASDITVAGSNVSFVVARTNVPPDGTYRCELMGYTGVATNAVIMLAHGTLDVRESLYDDVDSTFAYPNVTNLVDYLTIAAAEATYATIGSVFGGQVVTSIVASTDITVTGSVGTKTVAHTTLSSQADSDNSGGTVVQDLFFLRGHVTNMATLNLDTRYYTETETDSLTNGLWAGLWNTNTALLSWINAQDTATSNGLVTRLNGTNAAILAALTASTNALQGQITTLQTGKTDLATFYSTTDVIRAQIGSTGTAAVVAANTYTDSGTNSLYADATNRFLWRNGTLPWTGEHNAGDNNITNLNHLYLNVNGMVRFYREGNPSAVEWMDMGTDGDVAFINARSQLNFRINGAEAARYTTAGMQDSAGNTYATQIYTTNQVHNAANLAYGNIGVGRATNLLEAGSVPVYRAAANGTFAVGSSNLVADTTFTFSLQVQDPTNSLYYWTPNPLGKPVTLAETFVQTHGMTGMVAIAQRARTGIWNTAVTMDAAIVADTDGTADTSPSGATVLTNGYYIGFTPTGISAFATTNFIIVDFKMTAP